MPPRKIPYTGAENFVPNKTPQKSSIVLMRDKGAVELQSNLKQIKYSEKVPIVPLKLTTATKPNTPTNGPNQSPSKPAHHGSLPHTHSDPPDSDDITYASILTAGLQAKDPVLKATETNPKTHVAPAVPIFVNLGMGASGIWGPAYPPIPYYTPEYYLPLNSNTHLPDPATFHGYGTVHYIPRTGCVLPKSNMDASGPIAAADFHPSGTTQFNSGGGCVYYTEPGNLKPEQVPPSKPKEVQKPESYADKMERWMDMGDDEFCYYS